jgi:hypothetical protein
VTDGKDQITPRVIQPSKEPYGSDVLTSERCVSQGTAAGGTRIRDACVLQLGLLHLAMKFHLFGQVSLELALLE